MDENRRFEHWERVYASKLPEQMSWYQATPATSLALVEASGVGPQAGILDVGGGSSRFVDGLLDRGFDDVTVLDVSRAALVGAVERLGPRAEAVAWVVADVTDFEPTRLWSVWHDRAVFHFLTTVEDRGAYGRTLRRCLVPGGWAVIATFALSGPNRCSGLDVRRYSPESVAEALGEEFELVTGRCEDHVTPSGADQAFSYALLRFRGTPATHR
jgi:SAM-dependent methyltransferase